MVWSYGGGFTSGSKAANTPEGLFDLSKEFIFVAYNYRLGITGYANDPSMLHEGGTSNVGLWDAQHAFQWVRRYIGAFGGDSQRITAAGFSAGGSQTIFQMTRLISCRLGMCPGRVISMRRCLAECSQGCGM